MLELNTKTTAPVMVGLQEGILSFAGGPHTAQDVVTRAAQLTGKFHAHSSPVVMVRVDWPDDYAGTLKQPVGTHTPAKALPENWWHYPAALGKCTSDTEVAKRQRGAFCGTDLELQLRYRGIDTIVLRGIPTSAGAESTAENTQELGSSLIIAEDTCSAASVEQHQGNIAHIFSRTARVCGVEEILQTL